MNLVSQKYNFMRDFNQGDSCFKLRFFQFANTLEIKFLNLGSPAVLKCVGICFCS